MKRHNRLGDALSVLTGLDNWCRYMESKRRVTVCSLPVAKDIMDLFQFQYLDYDPQEGNAECLDSMFGACSWREDWPSRFFKHLCRSVVITHSPYGNKPAGLTPGWQIPNVTMPESRVGAWRRGTTAYAQLDTRSGKPLTRTEMKRMVAIAAFGQRVAVLGGPDTSHYLGDCHEYVLGNVGVLATALLDCHHFIGVDSGVGHLAGHLKVPSYVVNTCGFEAVYAFFGAYKECHFIDRSFINKGDPRT